MPPPRCRRLSRASACLFHEVERRDKRLRRRRRPGWEHVDRVHRALLEARAAPRTAVIVEAVAAAGPELYDGLFGTRANAAVAFTAIPAGEAPLCLVTGFGSRQRAHD